MTKEQFREKLISLIKEIYGSKSQTIEIKVSEREFVLVALSRALSYRWHEEEIEAMRRREQDALDAFNSDYDLNKALRKTAEIMGWSPAAKKKRNLKSPEVEKEIIDSFNFLIRFSNLKTKEGPLTRREAVEKLCEEYEWTSYESMDKYIKRKLIEHKPDWEGLAPAADQGLEDMMMEIRELEKRMDIDL